MAVEEFVVEREHLLRQIRALKLILGRHRPGELADDKI